MSPTKLRDQIESTGVKLGVRKGVLHASKNATEEQRKTIAANKRGLIAVLTYDCPECNQKLRCRVSADETTWLECALDPVHYGEQLGKLETIECPGDDCTEQIQFTDGVGWCPKHRIFVALKD